MATLRRRQARGQIGQANGQVGQALVEYSLLLLTVAALAGILFKPARALMGKLEAPLRNDFARTYKYGDPKTCGRDDSTIPDCSGGPARHPRISGGGNFRMFGRGDR